MACRCARGRGELRLDAGAVTALRNGKSLLPVGVVEVVGNFRRGDVVTLVDGGQGTRARPRRVLDHDAARLRVSVRADRGATGLSWPIGHGSSG